MFDTPVTGFSKFYLDYKVLSTIFFEREHAMT